MADWPGDLDVAPIREWPGTYTTERRHSPFRGPGGKPTKLTTTLADLKRELEAIAAKDAQLLIAIPAEKFRRDGRPYANSVAEHPGIILSFEIRGVGVVSYPCDVFLTWEDNLRAVVLSLEALRKVNRYGVTKRNEQYQGFLAIEARAAGVFTSDETALRYLMEAADMIVDPALDAVAAFDSGDRRRIAAKALFKTHPDRGGDRDVFEKCLAAQAHLKAAELL